MVFVAVFFFFRKNTENVQSIILMMLSFCVGIQRELKTKKSKIHALIDLSIVPVWPVGVTWAENLRVIYSVNLAYMYL